MRVGSYTFEEPADALIARFAGASAEDKAAETKARRFGKLALFCGVGAFLALLPGLPILGSLAGGIGLAVSLASAAVLFVLAVVFLVIRSLNKGHDLDDRKLATVLRTLKVVRADVPQAARVHLKVDFRDYKKGGRLASKEGGFFSSVHTYLYEHTWLQLGLRLADGSRVHLVVTQHVKRKERRKRKYTKVRARASSVVALGVGLARRYGPAQPVAARLEQLPCRGALVRKRVAARNRSLRATLAKAGRSVTSGEVSADALVDAGDLLQALQWVYRGIAGGRKAA